MNMLLSPCSDTQGIDVLDLLVYHGLTRAQMCAVDERELFFSIEVEIPQVFCQKDTSGFFVIHFFALMIQVTG